MNIESYLDEIEGRLKEHVPEDRRTEILRELRSHLWMSRNGAIEELQMPVEDAEKAALNLMGSPQLLAEDIVRRETGLEAKSIWQMAVVPGAAMLVAHLAPWTLSSLGQSQWVGAAMSLNYVVLALLAVAVWKSRKWLIGPMAAWLSASFVLVIAAFLISPQPPRLSQADALQGIRTNIARAERAMAGDMSVTTVPGGYNVPVPRTLSSNLVLPYVPFAVPLGAPIEDYGQGFVPSLEEAKKAWSENGAKWQDQLRKDEVQIEASYSAWIAPKGSAVLSPIPHTIVSFSFEICVLTAVNATTLLLINRRRRRRSLPGRAIA